MVFFLHSVLGPSAFQLPYKNLISRVSVIYSSPSPLTKQHNTQTRIPKIILFPKKDLFALLPRDFSQLLCNKTSYIGEGGWFSSCSSIPFYSKTQKRISHTTPSSSSPLYTHFPLTALTPNSPNLQLTFPKKIGVPPFPSLFHSTHSNPSSPSLSPSSSFLLDWYVWAKSQSVIEKC